MSIWIVSNIPVGKFCQKDKEGECPYYVQNVVTGFCLKEKEVIVDDIKVCGINRENEDI